MKFRSRPALLAASWCSVAVVFSILLPVILFPQSAHAQQGPLDKSAPKGMTVEEIIKRFAAKEKEFKEARDQYTFRQDVKVVTLDGDTPDGSVPGSFRRDSSTIRDAKSRTSSSPLRPHCNAS